jgi:hypothetical protein
MRFSLLIRLFCVLLIMLSIVGESRADPQGLLLLGQPLQEVKLEYELQDTRNSTGRSSTTADLNRYFETYLISLPFAVLKRDFFDGNLTLGGRAEEDFFSSSDGQSGSNTSLGLTYNFAGVFTKRKPFTLYVNSSLSRDHIQQEFSPGYDLTTTIYGANAYYKNDFIPLNLSFTHDDTKLSGGNQDQDDSQDLLTFKALNNFRDFCQTNLGASYNMIRDRLGSNPAESLDILNADLSNSLSWRFGRYTPGTLASSLSYSKLTGASQLETYNLRESVNQALGKAMESGASYGYSAQTSPQYSTNTTTGNIWLSHKLFESLRTQLNGLGTFNKLADGEQNQITGTGTITYQKRLPLRSDLSLTVSESYQWNRQKSANPSRTQFNEQIKITDLGKNYPLANTNVTAVTEVWNSTHTIPYFRPADWNTFQMGDQTYLTINPAGLIHTGDTILVTYTYGTDTDLTIGATTTGVSGNYSLLDNLLRLYANYTITEQKLLSGSATYTPLGKRTTLTAGVESKFYDNTVGLKYDTTDDSLLNQNVLTGYGIFLKDFGPNRLNLTLTDNYNYWTDKSTGRNAWDNSLDATAILSRAFSRRSQGSIRAGYLRTDGATNRDSYYVSLDYGITLGKLRFTLKGQSTVNNNYNPDSSNINNLIHLTIERFFY